MSQLNALMRRRKEAESACDLRAGLVAAMIETAVTGRSVSPMKYFEPQKKRKLSTDEISTLLMLRFSHPDLVKS